MTINLEKKCVWKIVTEGAGPDKLAEENLDDYEQCIGCESYRNKACYFPISRLKEIAYTGPLFPK